MGVLIKARIFPTLKIKRFFQHQKSVSFPKITAGCSFLCSQQRESQSFTPCNFQPQILLMVAFMSGKNCLQSIGICSTQNTAKKKSPGLLSSAIFSCLRCCDACILPCAEQTTSRPLNRKPALRCRLLTHSDTLIKRTLFNTEVSQRSPERIHH